MCYLNTFYNSVAGEVPPRVLPGPRAPCTYRLRGHHLIDALLVLLGQDGELPCLLVLQALQNCLVLTLWSYFQLVILQCFVLLSLHFACVLELLFDLHFHSLPRKERREECEGPWAWRGCGLSTWLGWLEPQLPWVCFPQGLTTSSSSAPAAAWPGTAPTQPSSAQGTSILCPASCRSPSPSPASQNTFAFSQHHSPSMSFPPQPCTMWRLQI